MIGYSYRGGWWKSDFVGIGCKGTEGNSGFEDITFQGWIGGGYGVDEEYKITSGIKWWGIQEGSTGIRWWCAVEGAGHNLGSKWIGRRDK